MNNRIACDRCGRSWCNSTCTAGQAPCWWMPRAYAIKSVWPDIPPSSARMRRRRRGHEISAMKYLLSRASRPLLARLAHERTLCAFDFDGTLAPIADHPDRAGLRKRTRDLLRRVASLYPCIIVSGRNRASVLEKLNGVQIAGVLGNHGAESGETAKARQDVKRWKTALEHELDPLPGTLPGIWIEEKESSLAIHYRQSPSKAEAQRRIFPAARKLKNLRVFGGLDVVNVVRKLAPHKGDALVAERDRLQCNWVLYL